MAARLSPYAPASNDELGMTSSAAMQEDKQPLTAGAGTDALGWLRTADVDVDLVPVARLVAHQIKHLRGFHWISTEFVSVPVS